MSILRSQFTRRNQYVFSFLRVEITPNNISTREEVMGTRNPSDNGIHHAKLIEVHPSNIS